MAWRSSAGTEKGARSPAPSSGAAVPAALHRSLPRPRGAVALDPSKGEEPPHGVPREVRAQRNRAGPGQPVAVGVGVRRCIGGDAGGRRPRESSPPLRQVWRCAARRHKVMAMHACR
jgi:hypothetical protein